MTLHFSQIGLTDDLTFTVNPPSTKKSEYDNIIDVKLLQGLFLTFLFFVCVVYLSRHMILPFERSYGDISIVTVSPGSIFI